MPPRSLAAIIEPMRAETGADCMAPPDVAPANVAPPNVPANAGARRPMADVIPDLPATMPPTRPDIQDPVVCSPHLSISWSGDSGPGGDDATTRPRSWATALLTSRLPVRMAAAMWLV